MNCKNCDKKLKNYKKIKKVIYSNIFYGTFQFCSKVCKKEYIATLRAKIEDKTTLD